MTQKANSKLVRKAIESASQFNNHINRQRPAFCVDMQTGTANYPVGLGRHNKTLTETGKIGRYPVAVLPNQFQDWYIEYSNEELRSLPVKTVLRPPVMAISELPPVLYTPDVSEFDSDSEYSYSSSDSISDEEETKMEGDQQEEIVVNGKRDHESDSECSVCVRKRSRRSWPNQVLPSPPHLTPVDKT